MPKKAEQQKNNGQDDVAAENSGKVIVGTRVMQATMVQKCDRSRPSSPITLLCVVFCSVLFCSVLLRCAAGQAEKTKIKLEPCRRK